MWVFLCSSRHMIREELVWSRRLEKHGCDKEIPLLVIRLPADFKMLTHTMSTKEQTAEVVSRTLSS